MSHLATQPDRNQQKKEKCRTEPTHVRALSTIAASRNISTASRVIDHSFFYVWIRATAFLMRCEPRSSIPGSSDCSRALSRACDIEHLVFIFDY